MSVTARGVDPALVTRIVDRVKSQGIFDQFRRDCLADVDTKPAYQNLRSKVEGYVSTFLSEFTWTPEMNKNQLRNSLRRQINESEMLASGVERIIEQVVEPKIQHIFLPRIETVVKQYLHSDNTPTTSSSDAKTQENGKLSVDSTAVSSQPGSSAVTSTSPAVVFAKASPTDSPLVLRNIPTPPPPPTSSVPDHPKPPPLPDASAAQDQPPPPLPDSRAATPPPLPPNVLPEPNQSSSASSSPSLDSLSSGPRSASMDDIFSGEKTKQELGKDGSDKSAQAKGPVLGKGILPRKKVSIVKKVLVKKADGTKVIRVVRVNPTNAHANTLLIKAASRAAGEQAEVNKQDEKVIPPVKVKTEDGKDESRKNRGGVELPADVSKDSKLGIKAIDIKRQNLLESTAAGKSRLSSTVTDTKSSDKQTSVLDINKEPISTPKVGLHAGPSIKYMDGTSMISMEEAVGKQPSVDREKDSEVFVKSYTVTDIGQGADDVSSPISLFDSDKEADDMDTTNYFPDDVSELDSHVSDVTVSSVHTSDLSSFDEKISSSSSSSSSDLESDEEEFEDYSSKKEPDKLQDVTQTSVPATDALSSSDNPGPEASISPTSSGGKASPKPAEAKWKRRYISESEDETTRMERRRIAAEAKEERAKRRQQLKEEREKDGILDPTFEESKNRKRPGEDDDMAEGKLSKQQLKEQKLLEKRREAKRQRTLLSQSEDGGSQVEQTRESPPRTGRSRSGFECIQPSIYRQGIYLKKRQASHSPFHYMLTSNLTYKQLLKKSQQRAKYFQVKAKEDREGKKVYCRFSFQLVPAGKVKHASNWQKAAADRKKALLRDATVAAVVTTKMTGSDKNSKEMTETVISTSSSITDKVVTLPVDPEGDVITKEDEESTSKRDIVLVTEDLTESSTDPKVSGTVFVKMDELSKVKESEEKTEFYNQIISSVVIQETNISAVSEVSPVKREAAGAEVQSLGDSVEHTKQDKVSAEATGITAEPVPEIEHTEATSHEESHVEEQSTCEEMPNRTLEPCEEEPERCVTPCENEVTKVPSIFQQTEDISSEEELEELSVPTYESKQESESVKGEQVSMDLKNIQETARLGKVDNDHNEAPAPVQVGKIEPDAEVCSPNIATSLPEDSAQSVAQTAAERKEQSSLPTEVGQENANLKDGVPTSEIPDDESLENPPTPTMDEPTEFEGLHPTEPSNDGQPSSIPIVMVHSPKGSGRCRIFGLSHSYSAGGAVGNEIASKSTEELDVGEMEEEENMMGTESGEIEEGELDAEIEEGEVPEEKDGRSSRELRYRQSTSKESSREAQSGYGIRPRRRTYSPHQAKDDNYFYFGLPKRSRNQSPTPPPSQGLPIHKEASQKKPATRERTRSGGSIGSQTKEIPTASTSKDREERVPSALVERRSSRHARRVSPPRRYSPSEPHAVHKNKSHRCSSPSPAPPPVPIRHEPSPPPQQHRHYTRRASGRDEERRPHRYEDMYYYDNKRSRTNPTPPAAVNKPMRRTSSEDRRRKR